MTVLWRADDMAAALHGQQGWQMATMSIGG